LEFLAFLGDWRFGKGINYQLLGGDMSEIDGFSKFEFSGPLADGEQVSHTVFFKGDGPPIIIWQELPGILPEMIDLANRMAEKYTIYMPHLFGRIGKFDMGRNLLQLCIRREFHLFAGGKSSPIANWMRALCRDVQSRHDGQQVGTLGMCLTGGFALTLMADDSVLGGVASQPSLPMFKQTALHMSDAEITEAKAGMAAKGPALAMRYEGDILCKRAKMTTLEQAFGAGIVTHEFPGRKHALLTGHYLDEAYEMMMAYFDARFGLET
jgi:dienelactone hydrolase